MVRDVPLSGGKRLKCRGVVPEGKTVAPPTVVSAPVVRLQPQGGGGFIFKKRTASSAITTAGVTFQMAKVAFPRDLFADILRRIYRSDRRQVWHDEQATIHER